MTYNTKAEFMAALKSQAEKYSLSFGEMACLLYTSPSPRDA